MRRIVVIASGMAGLTCATRIKRRLPESEVNVIIPAALEHLISGLADGRQDGPAAKRLAAGLPDLATLAAREVGVLEAQDIMPDLDAREVTVTSSRGSVTIRYSELVLEAPAVVRPPRSLQKAANVFGWPMSDFADQPEACDLALAKAAAESLPVAVVGDGVAALDAVFLAREAGARAFWLAAAAPQDIPDIDPLLLEHALRALGPAVVRLPLPDTSPERLAWQLNSDGSGLEAVRLPDGAILQSPCWLLTSPVMARHPILREQGVTLDSFGRITIEEDNAPTGLLVIGSGSAVPPAPLGDSGQRAPVYSGGQENAEASAGLAAAAVTGRISPLETGSYGALGVVAAATKGICLCRAGYSMAEASRHCLEAEYAVADFAEPHSSSDSRLILSLVCDKASRCLLGAQALGLGDLAAQTEGLFGMALAALADGTRLDALAARPVTGLPGRLLRRCAAILVNKLDTIINGISPDELLASHAAGAEFFTLDLRPEPQWRQGHIAKAHNIPLAQLKKRLQAEVPRFTPLVLISEDGADAYATACKLAALGATSLYVLDGGMRLWPYALEAE